MRGRNKSVLRVWIILGACILVGSVFLWGINVYNARSVVSSLSMEKSLMELKLSKFEDGSKSEADERSAEDWKASQ